MNSQQKLIKSKQKRIHLAIMKSDWNLTEKIISGEKTIESRWYKNRYCPWDKINSGDIVYFKDSGQPVTAKAKVAEVEQYSNLTPAKTKQLLNKYSASQLGVTEIIDEIKKHTSGKNYAIFIKLKNPQKIKPFNIDKTGYGTMSAWLIVDNIEDIKK